MNEAEAAKLAKYRVGDENDAYRAMDMTEEQIQSRRAYMRNLLNIKPNWKDLSDEQIDNMRLYRFGDDFIVEDEQMNEHVL